MYAKRTIRMIKKCEVDKMRFSQEQREKYLSALGSSMLMKDHQRAKSEVDYRTVRETVEEHFFWLVILLHAVWKSQEDYFYSCCSFDEEPETKQSKILTLSIVSRLYLILMQNYCQVIVTCIDWPEITQLWVATHTENLLIQWYCLCLSLEPLMFSTTIGL